MGRKKKERKWPIAYWILLPLMVLLALEIIIITASTFGQGITRRLQKNEEDIFSQNVSSKAAEFENSMIQNWSNVTGTVNEINAYTQELIDSGEINLETMDDSSEESLSLLEKSVDPLIDMMRTNKVTGAYLILNTDDIETEQSQGICHNKPCVYLRDYDPNTGDNSNEADLLFECAPGELVKKRSISTDTSWTPTLEQDEEGQYIDFFYQTFTEAYKADGIRELTDYCYWSKAYDLNGTGKEAVSYAVPLVLADGTVYGVLGVDLTLLYMESRLTDAGMPSGCSYGLLVEEDGAVEQITSVGSYLSEADNGKQVTFDRKKVYYYDSRLNIYNSNTVFSNQKWLIAGVVEQAVLYSFSYSLQSALIQGIGLIVVLGAIGSILISKWISKPIERVTDGLRRKAKKSTITIKKTKIEEVDEMLQSIEELNLAVRQSAEKFTNILKMSSVKMAGFELNLEKKTLFATEDFFEIFGLPSPQRIEFQEFCDRMKELNQYVQSKAVNGILIYRVPHNEGISYIRLRFFENATGYYGLLEDITTAMAEKELLKQERDHDILTGLYNRRAFMRIVSELFENKKDRLKTAAVVMLDLDNLKYVNDTYGHEAGDAYIKEAAAGFMRYTPKQTISARISGDEFNLVLYGYDSKEEVRSVLNHMMRQVQGIRVELAKGVNCNVRLSGGVAWYPEDSESYEKLLQYADYAMYQVKRSTKNAYMDFDLGLYSKEEFQQQKKEEFLELIQKKSFIYYFQPIVAVKTNQVFGYEMLIRADMPLIKGAGEIIQMAREMDMLGEIENLTMEKSLEYFDRYARLGKIQKGCRIFINSIPGQTMSPEVIQCIEQKYRKYLSAVVLEFTEESELKQSLLERKIGRVSNWGGEIALDDYGTGYNSEQNLLQIGPKYIKVDMSIIRNIDKEPDKQEIVSYIVHYAHERGKFIIAEGVETEQEDLEVRGLGVDFIQGYYYGKPMPEPLDGDGTFLK